MTLKETHAGTPSEGVIARVEFEAEEDLADLQRRDSKLNPIIDYLEKGILPSSEQAAKHLALTESQYMIHDSVLFRVEPDSTLRVIPPVSSREKHFKAHGGRFWAHLEETKVYSELRRHYWWAGMRSDVTRWTRGCLVCLTHSPGHPVKAPLTPIPVSGPFNKIGVDVIQLPKTAKDNQYAVVFIDYLPEVFAVPHQTSPNY